MGRGKSGRDPNEASGPKPGKRDAAAERSARMAATTQALLAATQRKEPEHNPFRLAKFPKAAVPPGGGMAQDSTLKGAFDDAAMDWDSGGAGRWGVPFLGYNFLAELAQQQEYRVLSETIADDATRKWVDFDVTGDEAEAGRRAQKDPRGEAERQADPDERKKRVKASGKGDRVKALRDDMDRLEARKRFYELCRDDGFFGRSHLYINFGEDAATPKGQKELTTPVGDGRDGVSEAKVSRGSLKELKVIEPMWSYPMGYNAVNPLLDGWYTPRTWYVMGTPIDGTRMLTMVSRPVPDMLKPAYGFGGVSLSQLAHSYVGIWLRTKQSVADLIHNFSVMVLMTDMETLLAPDQAGGLIGRAELFNAMRDNQALMVLNKESEDFKNVSAALGGLDQLQAQAQEHMSAISRIPLVKLTGISPSGLNASSEGEIRAYYDTIGAYQNRSMLPLLNRLVNFQQLSLFGKVDPEIKVRFEPLWELTDAELGEKQKADAERHQVYVDMGVVSSADVRRVIVDDPELPYTNLDPDDVPDLLEEEEEGLQPVGGRPEVQEAELQGGGKEDEG